MRKGYIRAELIIQFTGDLRSNDNLKQVIKYGSARKA